MFSMDLSLQIALENNFKRFIIVYIVLSLKIASIRHSSVHASDATVHSLVNVHKMPQESERESNASPENSNEANDNNIQLPGMYSLMAIDSADVRNYIMDNKQMIFGVAGFCCCAYQVFTLTTRQNELSQRLDEAIERIKEIDLSVEGVEQCVKSLMQKQPSKWMRKHAVSRL